MGLTKYLRELWKKPDTETLRKRMIEWRAGESIVKVEKPLRLDRARALGYKAKKGVIVVRVKLKRGGHKRSRPNAARRSVRMGIRKNLSMNYQEIAEQRASRKFKNMEVLNSYWIGKDGIHYFYEVILVDRNMPEIISDKELGRFVKSPQGRAFRGITSAGNRARGLRNSTMKAPKVRPSLRANRRRGN
jgi:large subunit ribosomal protein L15e